MQTSIKSTYISAQKAQQK